MIKSLTPTSAGFAQVFDTSGFVQQVKQTRQQRREKLNKDMLHYDPSGLKPEHIKAYQGLMQEYQDYVAENHSKLLNSSENMETWRGKQGLENEIKNFIAGSTNMNKDYLGGLNMTLTHKKYINEENEKLMEQYNKEITVEDFREGNAFFPVMKSLNRNTEIDIPQIADRIFKTIASEVPGADPETMSKMAAEGIDLYAIAQEYKYDPAKLDAIIQGYYSGKDELGGDIRHDYETVEEFKEAISPFLKTEGETRLMAKPRDPQAKEPTAAQKKAQFAITPGKFGGTITAGYTDVVVAPRKGRAGRLGKTEEIEQPTTGQFGVRAEQSLDYDPVRIKTQLDDAWNMSYNRSEDFAGSTSDVIVTESGMMHRNVSEADVEITMANGKPYKIPQGGFLPDVWNDKRFGDQAKAQVNAYMQNSRMLEYGEFAKAYALKDAVSLLKEMGYDDASINAMDDGEMISLIEASSRAGSWLLVPMTEKLIDPMNIAIGQKTSGELNYKQFRQDNKIGLNGRY
jgi:hypothetical protein